MVLRRKIETSLLEKSICVYDEIENQSFVKAPLMLLYHCNFGYPFLNEDCRLYLPTVKVEGREEMVTASFGSVDVYGETIGRRDRICFYSRAAVK